MNKRRVLIFSDCYIYGGSERLMMFLLKNETVRTKFNISFAYRGHHEYTKGLKDDFKRLGIKVPSYPVTLFSNETLFHKINCSQIPTFIKPLLKIPFFLLEQLGIYFFYNILRLYFLTKQIKPDLIHINNGGYPGAVSCNHLVFASKIGAISSIIYQINNIAYPQKASFAKFHDKLINKCVRHFITASSKAKEALINERHFSERKIKQIANTVAFEGISKERSELLAALNWPANTFLLVQVAFLTERKGQIYLLNALKEIKTTLPVIEENPIKLILVGNGEDELVLKKFVSDNNLEETVFFAGYQANSIDYITACDLFMLPSVSNEDMPLSLLTAMSNGKPIIASRFAGIAEALVHNENGILIKPDRHTICEDLKSKILELYANLEVRSKLGIAARKTFIDKYSENIYGEKICELYNLS